MINYDYIVLGIFIIFLLIFYVKKRKKIEFQGIVALYRTKLGTIFSKRVVSKAPKFFKYYGYLGIVVGFIGMIFIFYFLLKGSLNLIINPNATPIVAPVLPFIKIPGLPTLLFTYWIIGIFVVATIHEFSHALLSVTHKIKIKSSGFAFFGPLPAAFVEPDEKQLQKKSKTAQLSVFAAGPMANIVTGLLFLLILSFIISPSILATGNVGFKIVDIAKESPAELAGLKEGMIIEKINGLKASPKNLTGVISKLAPNKTLIIESKNKTFSLITGEDPKNKSKGFIGISIASHLEAKQKTNKIFFSSLLWINQLFIWLFIFSLGIGLVNLLPLGPLDGGRMIFTALTFFTTNKKTIKRIFNLISLVSLLIIIINFLPWITKFFLWFGRFMGLVS
ncbi:hypothetical protein B6U80_00025 [Candidatus Pacearchaeota archaeon ex4484_26]|nr:MAG: hypothetical protein B6U80_00025 [Candidatus Pacearchaeota archaeon ex4484_26]